MITYIVNKFLRGGRSVSRKLFVYVLLAIMAITAAGCSGSGQTGEAQLVEIEAGNMLFVTKEVTLQQGKPFKLVLKNSDVQLHDLSIDKIAGKVKAEHSDSHEMHGKKPDLHLSADAGKTAALEFTPAAKGTYEFYCTVAGHKEAGMKGTLVVN